MTIRSMTGYGCGEAESAAGRVSVEMSSVNRKHLDIRFDCCKSYAMLEPGAVELIESRVSRGAVTCRVKIVARPSTASTGLVNVARAEAYVRELRTVAARLGLHDNLDAATLVRLPDVLDPEGGHPAAEKIWPVMARAVKIALKALVAMREDEGARLASDLESRLKRMLKWVVGIEKRYPLVVKKYAAQLRKRVEELGVRVPVDDEKLTREIVFFAEKSDVTEELTRLHSHIDQFLKGLKTNKPVGRTLEFLAQEILREINTIAAKSNDARISNTVVNLKTETERIREQVQNIE